MYVLGTCTGNVAVVCGVDQNFGAAHHAQNPSSVFFLGTQKWQSDPQRTTVFHMTSVSDNRTRFFCSFYIFVIIFSV
jgi:hypothetical protein